MLYYAYQDGDKEVLVFHTLDERENYIAENGGTYVTWNEVSPNLPKFAERSYLRLLK